jgi:flagellar biosynthesis/type III secretory pathway chaperone
MPDRFPSSTAAGSSDPVLLRAALDLLAILEGEHRALSGNDIDALESAVQAKQALITQLGTVGARQAATTDTGLKSLIERCRHQNELNGAIVAARLHLAECGLAILRGESQATLYGPRGGTTMENPSGRTIARA